MQSSPENGVDAVGKNMWLIYFLNFVFSILVASPIVEDGKIVYRANSEFPRWDSKYQRVFYVCGYGGSGTVMLCRFLDQYGKTVHVHCRYPKELLQYVTNCHFSHRASGFVETCHLEKIKVIYIYRHPTLAQLSRWGSFESMDCIKLKYSPEDYVQKGEDCLKFEELFDNYVNKRINRNYQIIAINYHKLWDNLTEVFTALDLPLEDIFKFPAKVEGKSSYLKQTPPEWVVEGLNKINAPLIKKIEEMPAVKVLGPYS